MHTGYLLNYSFMSPRPYCWRGEDCLLSGWEVDRKGGTFAFSPNCYYPTGASLFNGYFPPPPALGPRPQFAALGHSLARLTPPDL
jgi:hypothetical protein